MYTIIPLQLSHLDEVQKIEIASFSDPWSRRMLADSIASDRSIVLAAVDGVGAVAGYVMGSFILDEGYLDNIAVRPDLRRQRVASLLLSALEEQARGRGLAFLTLEVRASNLPAQALYAKHGYLPVGRRKNYYQRPREDAILMTLEF